MIKERKKQELLSREEIIIELDLGKIFSEEEVKKKIKDELKASEELIRIKKIKPSYGSTKVEVLVYLYNNKEVMEKIEPKEKKKEKKEAKTAQQSKEEKQEKEDKEKKNKEDKTEQDKAQNKT